MNDADSTMIAFWYALLVGAIVWHHFEMQELKEQVARIRGDGK